MVVVGHQTFPTTFCTPTASPWNQANVLICISKNPIFFNITGYSREPVGSRDGQGILDIQELSGGGDKHAPVTGGHRSVTDAVI